MQRAQRGRDNPAANHAIEPGRALGLPVVAGFGLTADYPGAHRRHDRFLLEGLADAARDLEARGVPLVVRLGSPDAVIARLAREVRPAVVVGDENPVRVACGWRDEVAGSVGVPFHVVDADVFVPSALFPKGEYAARTLLGERPIFGTVRYMSHDSTRGKLDAVAYIARVESLG